MDEPKKVFFNLNDMPAVEITVSGEEARGIFALFNMFDVYKTVGKHCSVCHKTFTREFFDNGGTLKTHSDFWAHDYCVPSES